MLKLSIFIISFFAASLADVTFNDLFTDYVLPINVTYTNNNNVLTLVSAKNIQIINNEDLYFDMVVEANGGNLNYKDILQQRVSI
jgi:hypothetical protein